MAEQHLIDNWGRPIDYLRLAVTDRCNLRCNYCMPAEGINLLPKDVLLTYEEMEHLVKLFCELGINKVRITGGEPLVRRDIIPFLTKLSKTKGLKTLNMTTNGLLTLRHFDALQAMGIQSINLSLDTLDRERFKNITRRDEFDKVNKTLHALIASDIDPKINMVVMADQNIDDIIPMAELTFNHNISVRYIEEMPFNGGDANAKTWNHIQILEKLKSKYDLEKIADPAHATAAHYKINGAQGNLGIIAAFSRTFCGTCNRLRLTAQGELRTCLYANKGLNLRTLLREGQNDDTIKLAIRNAVNNRHKNGFEAEGERNTIENWESMSTIGG